MRNSWKVQSIGRSKDYRMVRLVHLTLTVYNYIYTQIHRLLMTEEKNLNVAEWNPYMSLFGLAGRGDTEMEPYQISLEEYPGHERASP